MLYEEHVLELNCSISELRRALNTATAGLRVEKAETPLLAEKPELAIRIRKRYYLPIGGVSIVDIIAHKKGESSCTVLMHTCYSSLKEKAIMGLAMNTSGMAQKHASRRLAKDLEGKIKGNL